MKEKMSEAISKNIKCIENIRECQWLLITFIICLIFMILISIPILWQPYIHAEDGTEFLKDALFEGKSSIFKLFGGYLGILPRLFAIIAIYFGRKFNSMIVVTYVMKLCSIIFPIIVINYFNSKEFKYLINNRILRLIISITLMSVMANHQYVIYTSITTHWWGGLLAFLVGLNFMNKKMPPLYIIPFLILSILSSPSALIVAIPIIYYLFSKLKTLKNKDIKEVLLKNKMKIFILLLIAIAGIIEVYSMIFLSTVVNNMNGYKLSMNNIGVVIVKTLRAIIHNIPFIFTRGLFNEKIRFIMGIIILTVLLWRYKKNKNAKVFIWGLVAIAILYFMAFYKRLEDISLPGGWFYNSIPATIGVLLIMKFIYDDFFKIGKMKKIFKLCTIMAFVIIASFFYILIKKPDYSFCNNIYNIEPNVNFSSNKVVEVEISPNEKWVTYVPVD